MNQQHKIYNSISSEEWKSVLHKNEALKSLANELADTVADKEQNIKHMKEVLRLLGNRVSELEQINKTLRGCVDIGALQNAQQISLPDVPIVSNGHSGHDKVKNGKGVLVVAKKVKSEEDSCDLP